MPVIRIDDDVYKWLQSQARPFEDTPNSVLRRLGALDVQVQQASKEKAVVSSVSIESIMGKRTGNGRALARREGLQVRQAFYHQDGTFFQPISEYPVALFDRYGYVVFPDERSCTARPEIRITEKTNIPVGISSLPGYRRMSRPTF